MEEQRTALVVLKPGLDLEAAPERAGETPPDPASVEKVVGWFRGRGFETGPFVGISFAVSGSDELFQAVLGDAVFTAEPGGEMEFSTAGLREDVVRLVAAIVVPAPPDFGPGNP